MTTSQLGLFTFAGFIIVLCQVCCEIGKQVSNYSIQYYNGGRYPLPQTVIVLLAEIIKLVATIGRTGCQHPIFDKENLKVSLQFLLPSVLYTINNNIYYYGLTLVPPPIWLILVSIRTVITASVYKFFLKREVTWLQFVGAVLIVLSIVVAKAGDIFSTDQSNSVPFLAIVLAIIASCNSVGTAVYTETLFKNAKQDFLEQQFWLYLYGSIVATLVHFVSAANFGLTDLFTELSAVNSKIQFLLTLALLFSSVGGLVVAAILKKLDNVVKEYSGATANIFTAVICSLLFPEKFTFSIYIIFAMCFLFAGIYLYEKAKPSKTVVAFNGEDNIEKNEKPSPSETLLSVVH